MFRTEDLTVTTPDGGKTLLAEVRAEFPRVGLHAVVGPSGCGKTTLVKAMLGLVPSTGRVEFAGREVSEPGDLVGRVGFAPQFSIANPKLTVEESLAYALDLLVADGAARGARMTTILEIVGLDAARHTRVENLSGGQLRRLGLGLELVNDPDWLVCDEVTSGLDPRSEDQILGVLRALARERGKSFICIIHNLAKLRGFDRITVLGQGALLFQGTYPEFLAHFKIEDPLHLYERLNEQSMDAWQSRWIEARNGKDRETVAQAAAADADASGADQLRDGRGHILPVEALRRPGIVAQVWTLLRRRGRFFGETGAI